MKRIALVACFCIIGFFVIRKLVSPPAFRPEIDAFIRMDKAKMPPPNGIVFVGSSSFTKWKGMSDSFPGYPVINRGFGGSSIQDIIRYADDIIFAYKPKQVILYSGDNDLAFNDKVDAQTILSRYTQLITLVRKKLPDAQITVVSIKPSPKRWRYDSLMVASNLLLKDFLSHLPNTQFVDVHSAMLNADGSVKSELFVADSFHMNPKGYAIWTKAIKPVLLK